MKKRASLLAAVAASSPAAAPVKKPKRLHVPGLCQCGCGKPTLPATRTNRKAGKIKGEPCPFLPGHTDKPRKLRSLEECFREKFTVGAPDECWLWTGALKNTGYAALSHGSAGDIVYAHRLAVELDGREIPPGMVIDHLCRVRHCVNPAHLEVVTHQVNILRGMAPSAIAARTGICKRGHVIRPEDRQCRECQSMMWRAAEERRRAARAEREAA